MIEAVIQKLEAEDDQQFWQIALSEILVDLSLYPGVQVIIGCCSHWLRPHQNHWIADGGFAFPSGYGDGHGGGFSNKGLPQFDWSVRVEWTGKKWIEAKDKSGKPSVRITLPSRTMRHQQAAVHTLWMTGKEKKLRLFGFRKKGDDWKMTAFGER